MRQVRSLHALCSSRNHNAGGGNNLSRFPAKKGIVWIQRQAAFVFSILAARPATSLGYSYSKMQSLTHFPVLLHAGFDDGVRCASGSKSSGLMALVGLVSAAREVQTVKEKWQPSPVRFLQFPREGRSGRRPGSGRTARHTALGTSHLLPPDLSQQNKNCSML